MAKIKTYPTGTPEAGDLVLFTDVSDNNATKNMTMGEIISQCSAAVAKAHLYVAGDGASYQTSTTAGEWIDLVCVTQDVFSGGGLDVDTNGTITYTGDTSKLIAFNGVVDVAGTANNSLATFAFFYNGVQVGLSAQTIELPNDGTTAIVPGVGMLEMSDGDSLQLRVNTEDNNTVTLSNINITLIEV